MKRIRAILMGISIALLGSLAQAQAQAQAQLQVTVETRLADGQPTVVVAHRSAIMGGLPENTLAWMEHALERGVDGVHINPQKTRDGHYVLMHDPTLNRMTDVAAVFPEGPDGGPTRRLQGGRDYLGYYTLDEVDRLRVTGGEAGGEFGVPTLGEALDFIDGRAIMFLGLKTYDVPSLAAALRGHDLQNVLLFELYVSGTDQGKLLEMAETTGLGVHVALYRSKDTLGDLAGASEALGPWLRGVHVRSRDLSPEFLSKIDDLGLRLFISGWDGGEDHALVENGNPAPWKAAIAVGTGVVTDRPDVVLELLGR